MYGLYVALDGIVLDIFYTSSVNVFLLEFFPNYPFVVSHDNDFY
jgi:hypothetical protein